MIQWVEYLTCMHGPEFYPSIPDLIPWALPRIIPEHRSRSKLWAKSMWPIFLTHPQINISLIVNSVLLWITRIRILPSFAHQNLSVNMSRCCRKRVYPIGGQRGSLITMHAGSLGSRPSTEWSTNDPQAGSSPWASLCIASKFEPPKQTIKNVHPSYRGGMKTLRRAVCSVKPRQPLRTRHDNRPLCKKQNAAILTPSTLRLLALRQSVPWLWAL